MLPRPVAGLLGVLLFASSAMAAPFVFYHGASIPELGITSYDGLADVRINDNYPNGNGGNDQLFVGDAGNDADNRSLIRFDITALAGYEVAGDATLRLRVMQVQGSPDAGDLFDLYRISPTNAGWVEGNNTSVTQAAAGLEPSWDHYSESPLRAWRDAAGSDLPTGPSPAGGLGQPGEGYEPTPIASINQASYAVGDLIHVTIPRDVVQAMIDGDTTGWILRKRDETDVGRVAFNKRESGNSPRLTVAAVLAERPLYADRVLADDPILYYRLDEASGAVAANGGTLGAVGDGAYAGPVTLGQAGPQPVSGFGGLEIANTAPDFPGSGGARVDLPAGVLPTGNAPRTIEGWINGTSSTAQNFLNYGPNTMANRVSVTAGPDRLAVAVSHHNYGVNDLNLKPGWHHVAVVLPDKPDAQSDEWLFFVDGVDRTAAATTLAASGGPPFTVNTIDSGNRRIGFNEGGGIDEVAVYDKALTGRDVFSHFATAIGMDGVAGASGQITPIGKPASIAQSQSASSPTTSNDTVFFFQEASRLLLADDVPVDITLPGMYGENVDDRSQSGLDGSEGGPRIIPAGTEVASYYLHYDSIASGVTGGGTITFDDLHTIVGVAFDTPTLQDTDGIFSGLASTQGLRLIPGHQYPDLFVLSPDRHSITFNLLNGGTNVDQIRIITTVPEPATLALLGLGLLLRRRRA